MSNFQSSPYSVEVEEGKEYYWCRCGESSNQPYCDGAHKDTGITPLPFSAKKTGTVHICGCVKTNSSPYCDGSHKEL